MIEKSFNDIMGMIVESCNNRFRNGISDQYETIIKCATQIYIAQMGAHAEDEEPAGGLT